MTSAEPRGAVSSQEGSTPPGAYCLLFSTTEVLLSQDEGKSVDGEDSPVAVTPEAVLNSAVLEWLSDRVSPLAQTSPHASDRFRQ